MNSQNNHTALALIGVLAMFAILAMFAMLLQPTPAPEPVGESSAQVVAPAAKHVKAGSSAGARVASSQVKTVSTADNIAADLIVLMAVGVLALIVWIPFRIRRWKIESHARYQAAGWIDAQRRAEPQRTISPLR